MAHVSLDVRMPIGAMFFADGVILTVYGLVSPPTGRIGELAGNVNLWWGALLVVFGGAMLGSSLISGKRAKAAAGRDKGDV